MGELFQQQLKHRCQLAMYKLLKMVGNMVAALFGAGGHMIQKLT